MTARFGQNLVVVCNVIAMVTDHLKTSHTESTIILLIFRQRRVRNVPGACLGCQGRVKDVSGECLGCQGRVKNVSRECLGCQGRVKDVSGACLGCQVACQNR